MDPIIELENRFGAHNYDPLPIVLSRGRGIHVWDNSENRYMDMMGAYSAVSHGHCHPRIIGTLIHQAQQLSIVSRAFYTDKLAGFLEKACQLTGQEMALPMNSGAEAVETALKIARKWAYQVKEVAHDRAEIIVCENNFHGRTITIVGMSTEEQYKRGFGPFPSGFKTIPYGDAAALEKAITKNTAAFLVEPIQGEAGIIVPPAGYLRDCQEICQRHNVLLICDEIQTGLGRTGKFLASEHDGVKPDAIVLGKALGGGVLPVSMFLTKREVMDVIKPGDHGSTFGGNPLAAAVGLEALKTLEDEKLSERAAELGTYFQEQLQKLVGNIITEVRGKGLLIGLEINPHVISARSFCLRLLKQGLLTKEAHEKVVRLAPPLIIEREELDQAIDMIKKVLESF